MKPISALLHLDGWKNLLSGFGTHRDKVTTMSVAQPRPFTDLDLSMLYMGDGLSASIVDTLPEDAVKTGWEISGDDGTLYKALKKLALPTALKKALAWANLYGGALLVMDIGGAGAWDTPLPSDLSRLSLRGFRVYPRSRIEFLSQDMVKDPQSPYFEDFERFEIYNKLGGTFRVHASRCIPFHGVEVPDKVNAGFTEEQLYWGLSILPRCAEAVSALAGTMQGVGNLGQELSIGKYKISNLEQMVAEGDYKGLEDRMTAIAMQKSIINGVLLGEGEDYTRDNLSLSGANELMDKMFLNVASNSRYPETKLFGRSPSGENATGESDMENYYSRVATLQEEILGPALVRIATLLNATLKVLPADSLIEVAFNPLWTQSDTEKSTVRKALADADNIYIQAGVLSPDEVRENRFVGGYSMETAVDSTNLKPLSGPEPGTEG